MKNENTQYPSLEDAHITIPFGMNDEKFREGFNHSVRGHHLTNVSHLKKSFRAGFRAGRLYLKEIRKMNNIIDFPSNHKIKFKIGK